jgi:predicted Zn-dependent peptidase
VASRRLFNVVREDKMLTYDANFVFYGSDIESPGYFIVSVTSSPDQVIVV